MHDDATAELLWQYNEALENVRRATREAEEALIIQLDAEEELAFVKQQIRNHYRDEAERKKADRQLELDWGLDLEEEHIFDLTPPKKGPSNA